MDLLRAIQQCITGRDADNSASVSVNEKYNKPVADPRSRSAQQQEQRQPTEAEIASSVISTLFNAEKAGHDLERNLQHVVRSCGWYEGLAKRILDALVAALNSGVAMGGAIKEAFDRATAVASKFIHEHPVLAAAAVTLVAIGILVILAPWAVEALGFGGLGPIRGSFAALWQSTFPDVAAGSFFSWLQRLGMMWGKR